MSVSGSSVEAEERGNRKRDPLAVVLKRAASTCRIIGGTKKEKSSTVINGELTVK